jgi:predicted Zn-dependent protease with MMP-like domain
MARLHDVDRYTTPPELTDFEAMAREGMARIPDKLRNALGGVTVLVEDFPDDETLDEMGLESPFDLLGLYRGVDLTRKSLSDPEPAMDTIHLYRRPILDYWAESGEDLRDLVAHVIIHEIGHHFGFSDEEMERIESEAPSPR